MSALPWPPPGARPIVRPPPSRFSFLPRRLFVYGVVLFVAGWAGILFQRGFLRQLIVGAPLFEELAKLGPALVVVGILRLRPVALRLPFAWASGAAFGLVEHALTYAEEPPLFLGLRVAFHLATCGLSMAAFTLLEAFADARVRWGATIPSSLLHAANNFGALLFAILGEAIPTDLAATAWALMMTVSALAITAILLLERSRALVFARALVSRFFPALVWEPPGP